MATRPSLPGRPVRGSSTGRPVMALLDLLGRRGTLRLLWELRDGQPLTFRTLQANAGDMSSSVLNGRLRDLRAARLVDMGEGGYVLTRSGLELMDHLGPLSRWSQGWAKRLARPRAGAPGGMPQP